MRFPYEPLQPSEPSRPTAPRYTHARMPTPGTHGTGTPCRGWGDMSLMEPHRASENRTRRACLSLTLPGRPQSWTQSHRPQSQWVSAQVMIFVSPTHPPLQPSRSPGAPDWLQGTGRGVHQGPRELLPAHSAVPWEGSAHPRRWGLGPRRQCGMALPPWGAGSQGWGLKGQKHLPSLPGYLQSRDAQP